MTLVSSDTSSGDDDEANAEGNEVPLEGSMLAGINYDGEDPMDLARARLAATPRMLFPSTSQPGSSDPEHQRRPSFSSPPIPPVMRRSKRIADFVDRRREIGTDEPETPLLVASQASVSASPSPALDMQQMMLTFMAEMRANREADQKMNMDMLEKQRLDNESRLDEQRKDMLLRLDQQRQDMISISQETIKAVVNQVPNMVQSALAGVMNVAPLQLKQPTTSQPEPLMIMGNTTTPRGSGTSTQIGTSRMRAPTEAGPPHERVDEAGPSHKRMDEADPPQKRIESPENTLADFGAITMEVADMPQPTGSPAAG